MQLEVVADGREPAHLEQLAMMPEDLDQQQAVVRRVGVLQAGSAVEQVLDFLGSTGAG